MLLLRGKGNRRHRVLGWTYASSMLVCNGTALMITKLFGGFGPFHAAALVSLVGTGLGVWSARQGAIARRLGERAQRAQWVERHYYWMTWSYVGLIAALASEIITRHPAFRPVLGGGVYFGLAVGAATLAIVAIGSQWIRRSHRDALAPFSGR